MVNFLVVRPDKMGDAIITQVILEALYKTVPCNIDVFASNYSYRYYDDNPYIRKVFNCDIENKQEMYSLYKTVCKTEKYDAVFVLQARRRLQKMALLGKCKCQFGFYLAFDFRFDSRIFEWIAAKIHNFHYLKYNLAEHEILNLKNLLNFGLKHINLPELVPLPNHCVLYSKAVSYVKHKLPNSIVINISGKSAEQKIILPSMLTALLFLLLKAANKISIVALAHDINIAHDVINMVMQYHPGLERPEIISDDDVFAVANKINPYEYYIGPDGGLLHVAAGLNLKCIGLFNDDMKHRWYPWTPYQVTLSSEISYEISPVAVMNALATLGYK